MRVGIEPDRQQVPARTAVLAAAVGVATVTGVLVYTASAQHLRETAAERGVVWDELVYVADQDRPIELAGVVREWAEVDEVGPALYFTMGLVMGPDERETRVMAFGGAPADIEPRVISGRAPAGDAEVALNPKLAADLAVAVGDTIDVSLSTLGVPPDEAELLRAVPARAFEVVGTAAVPLGDGFFGSACAMTIDGYLTLLPDVLREEYAGQADFLMIRRGDDVGADALVTRLAEIDVDHEPLDPLVAEDVLDNILSVDRTGTESVPDLLGWLMLVTGTGVLTYGVVMTLSRNRRELAIVRAVGFDRRLLRRTSRCVGLVQGTAALTLGLPLGVIAGRYAWHLYARSLGVAEIEHVPVVELAALVGATLLFGVLVASLAGRWVGRRSVGAVLRTVE